MKKKHMKIIRNILAVVCIAIIAGCATGRTADLRDCGRFSVGVGPGLGLEAEIGVIANPSLGIMSVTRRVGFEDRNVIGIWDDWEIYAPVISIVAITQKHKGKYDVSYSRSVEQVLYPSATRSPRSQKAGRWINIKSLDNGRPMFNRATNIEVGASLLFVSARAGINPLEIVDFILGFFGIDIANDDPKKKDKEKPTTKSTPTK
jgi:hypothetical protein